MDGRLSQSLIQDAATVAEATERMDGAPEGELFVVDCDGRVVGIVTERGLRHWIADGSDMHVAITNVMAEAPKSLTRADSANTAVDRMRAAKLRSVPVVDEYGAAVDVVRWGDLVEVANQPDGDGGSTRLAGVTVVVMAGGLGTRLAPYSTILPKPLMPIGEMTAIEHVMEPFAKAGCTNFIVSLGHRAELIKAYFADRQDSFEVAFIEEERPLGTAGSLGLMRERLEDTFFLTNCDVILKASPVEILDSHVSSSCAATIVAARERHQVPYGVLEVLKNGRVAGISEKPHFDFLVNTGIYVLEPEVLRLLPPGEAVDMPTVIEVLSDEGRVGYCEVTSSQWLDIGQLEQLQGAIRELAGGAL